MVKSVEGVYRNGKVELLETPPGVNDARVIVTFLPASGSIDLQQRGMTQEDAADLHARLRPFAEDWERPEMDVYDALSARRCGTGLVPRFKSKDRQEPPRAGCAGG